MWHCAPISGRPAIDFESSRGGVGWGGHPTPTHGYVKKPCLTASEYLLSCWHARHPFPKGARELAAAGPLRAQPRDPQPGHTVKGEGQPGQPDRRYAEVCPPLFFIKAATAGIG